MAESGGVHGGAVAVALLIVACWLSFPWAVKKDSDPRQRCSPAALTGFPDRLINWSFERPKTPRPWTNVKLAAPDYGLAAVVTYTSLIDQPSDTGGATGGECVKGILPTGSLRSPGWGHMTSTMRMNQLGPVRETPSPIRSSPA